MAGLGYRRDQSNFQRQVTRERNNKRIELLEQFLGYSARAQIYSRLDLKEIV